MKARLLIILAVFAGILTGRADEILPVLTVGSEVYSNVTVTTVTATDVFFTYPGGMGNAKLKDLSPDLQQHFKLNPSKAKAVELKQAGDAARYHDQLLHQPVVKPPSEAITDSNRSTHPTQAVWREDYPGALAQAQSEGKLVLLDFTGSDWCSWCMKFKKEVLDMPEFQDYAAKSVVLVELDFPNKKEQTDDLKKANAALKSKYKINGFPTLVVLDQNGKEIGRQVGYAKGGPQAFIAKLEKYKAGE